MAGVIHHLQRALQFLLRDKKRRINPRRLLKIGQRLLQFALIAEFLPLMDDRSRCLKAQALERRLITQILWFQVVSLFVKIVGSFEVFPRLGVLALVIGSLGLIGDGRQYGDYDQQHGGRRLQKSHSYSSSIKSSPDKQTLPHPPAKRGFTRPLRATAKERFRCDYSIAFPALHVIAPTRVILFGLSPKEEKDRLRPSGFWPPGRQRLFGCYPEAGAACPPQEPSEPGNASQPALRERKRPKGSLRRTNRASGSLPHPAAD